MAVVLTIIGKLTNESESSDSFFYYKSKKYEKLMIWDKFEKLLELNSCTGFFLKETLSENVVYLSLCYSESFRISRLPSVFKDQHNFIMNSFFTRIYDGKEIEEGNYDNPEKVFYTLDNFYTKIKEAHLEENFDCVPENVQHPKLGSTILRPYQIKGVKWMLKRELEDDYVPSNYVMKQSKFNSEQIFYYNKYTEQLLTFKPEQYKFPKGGILADEMGLGKTVEMIALILMNPRKKGIKRKSEFDDMPLATIQSLKPTKSTIIRCMCNKEYKRLVLEKIIICTRCFKGQHIKCVFQCEITDEDRYQYLCPFCWKSSETVIDVKTTIIISPTSIKNQWSSELKRHVTDPNFKILIYNGIGTGWISPHEIAKYDCIVTDFVTLSRELYFAEKIDRQLRQSKKFEYPPSPLIRVNWWRVICDEAQMVENTTSRPSQMAKQLPTIHRWCCTGTPIEKGSVHHLYGLIHFLDVPPYTAGNISSSLFFQIWNDYRNGYPNVLTELMSKIMWRTCKVDVEHEIQIPEQKEIIHYVEMSDLQKVFYRQVHNSTKPEFLKHVQEYIYRNSKLYVFDEKKRREVKVADFSLMDKVLYELDNTTLKTFLEPLRKIRQDCTIANLFSSSNDHNRVKQTLRPDQLHEHLVSKTSIEAKSALRTLASSLNAMAALKINEMKYDEALIFYKQVLRLGQEYTGAVSVDSMLQIHSYNSILEIAPLVQDKSDIEKKDLYFAEMSKLEWKYISNYYDKVKEINKKIDEQRSEMRKTSREYDDHNGMWWRDIISIQRTTEENDSFLDAINTEMFSVVTQHQILEQVQSTYGIQLMLTEWIDKIERYTKDVNKRFTNLDFIIKNLRPSNELPPEVNLKIQKLAQDALDCHLNLFDTNDDDDDQPKLPKNPDNLCEMCKLKKKLDEYECTLFNKTIVHDIVEGTWNTRMEERLLKAIFTFAKRNIDEFEIIDMGKKFFKYLEALKSRYKFLAQLWVETNYTIGAFDELNMCKMRIQVVDSVEDITEEDAKYHLKILKHEVDDQMEVFRLQKVEAEVQFTRLNGRIKYLEHLKEGNEIPSCPICTNQTKERYYVTICGHNICAECFVFLTKDKRNSNMKINCPVCRTSQEIINIYGVTVNEAPSTSDIRIVGNYSPKIDEIIRCILKLKSNEVNVKILIFSHWDTILAAIINGLKANDITYRASFSGKFNKQITEFKDFNEDITCMMMNLKFGGKGLNLTEASHIFFVEPILNADDELQAIGRIHRIGQHKKTFVHKFIAKDTIESMIFDKIIQEKDKWMHKQFTIRDLENLFTIEYENAEDNDLNYL